MMPSKEDALAFEGDSLPEGMGRLQTYRRGERIVEAGARLEEWMLIRDGTAWVAARVAPDTRIPVAALWHGDVIGAASPLGKDSAKYDITALVDVTTLHLPPDWDERVDEALQHRGDRLFEATASRLHHQIAMRLAGNGLQRLGCVLSNLCTAMGGGAVDRDPSGRQDLQVNQSTLGELAGLSRRQTWVYLGQLGERGWVLTSHKKVVLMGRGAWKALVPQVAIEGLAAVQTVDQLDAALSQLLQWLLKR